MDTKEGASPTLEDRLHDEMIDAIDDEIELEIDDTRLSGLLADAGEKPDNTLERHVYFKELLRLQKELIKLQDWVADQKLFEDSLIRQQQRPSAPLRRSRRTGSIRKRNRPAPSGLVQDMLPGFGDEQGAADGEPVRGDGPQALGPVDADPVRSDQQPADAHRR